MKKVSITKLVGSIALSFLAGAIGSLATIPNIPSWYAALNKPFFSPPNWVFGPVWTLLYLLMSVSLYLLLQTRSKLSKRCACILFGAQLALNALWSLVFFGAHQPWLGAVIIVLLLVMIVWTSVAFWRINRVASYLLVPYIMWVTFASCLNIAVAVLN